MGVVTVLQLEFDAAREALGAEHQVPGSGYYTNDLDSYELVLAKSEARGNVASALTTRDLVEDFRPEVVLVVGIAGGIVGREGVALGDTVVPDYLHYADFRSLRIEEGDQPRHAPYDPPSVSLHGTCVFPAKNDDSWRDSIAIQPPEERGPPGVIVGPLVGGEKVYGDPTHEEQRRLVREREYSDAIAVDMESMGVAERSTEPVSPCRTTRDCWSSEGYRTRSSRLTIKKLRGKDLTPVQYVNCGSYERFAEELLATEHLARSAHGGEARIRAARFPARKSLD